MKKPNLFSVLSDVRCECGKPLKQNVVDRHEDVRDLVCFRCFHDRMNTTDNPTRTAREVRNNPSLRSAKRKWTPLRGAA